MKNVYATSAFLVNEGSVLLVLHKRLNFWLPVGGELEDGEQPLWGAVREVKEETGIELRVSDFQSLPGDVPQCPPGFLCFEEHHAGTKNGVDTRHMNFAFWAMSPTRDVVLCDEHHEFKWAPLVDLPSEELITTPNVAWCLIELRRRLRIWGWPEDNRPMLFTAEPWVGCGECDMLFPCHGGKERCARLTKLP